MTRPQVVNRGEWRGADCVPFGVNAGIWGAMKVAMKYAHRTPTHVELMRDLQMSRATAFRWLAAIKAAKGEA